MHLYPWFSSSLPFTPVPAAISLRSCAQLNLWGNQLGPEGAAALAPAIAVSASLTECNVRGNQLDGESATLLSKVAREKCVMLFGIKHDQTKVDFTSQGLSPVDAILLASDLSVSTSVTKILVGDNRLRDEGTIILCDALRESKVTKVQELDLSENSIGPEGAKAVAAMAGVIASLTSVR